jgi:hypothetical protein
MRLTGPQVALASGKDREAKEFTADGVYLPKDGDEAVYVQEVQPLVQSVHQGFNATILAYGEPGILTVAAGCLLCLYPQHLHSIA